jgi:hypothetical protein
MSRYTILLTSQSRKNEEPSHKKPRRKGLDPSILIGASVMTLKPLHDEEYTSLGQSSRKWGLQGVVRSSHDSHGLCYEVVHEDGTFGCYDPDEIEIILR